MQYTIVSGRENKRIDIEIRCRIYKKNVGFDKIKMSEPHILFYSYLFCFPAIFKLILYFFGVAFLNFRNTFAKYALSLNPHLYAISVTG